MLLKPKFACRREEGGLAAAGREQREIYRGGGYERDERREGLRRVDVEGRENGEDKEGF